MWFFDNDFFEFFSEKVTVKDNMQNVEVLFRVGKYEPDREMR